MSPIEKLSSTPNPAVLLFDFESAPAGLEESLAATLPEATRSRITAFCHPVRRRQTRWGRILASAAARILDAELVDKCTGEVLDARFIGERDDGALDFGIWHESPFPL